LSSWCNWSIGVAKANCVVYWCRWSKLCDLLV